MAAYKKVLTYLQSQFDVVVIDTGVTYTDELVTEICYPVSDQLIYTTIPSKLAVSDTEFWFKRLVALDETYLTKTGIVLNQYSEEMQLKTLADAALSSPLLGTIPTIPRDQLYETNMSLVSLLDQPEFKHAYFTLALNTGVVGLRKSPFSTFKKNTHVGEYL